MWSRQPWDHSRRKNNAPSHYATLATNRVRYFCFQAIYEQANKENSQDKRKSAKQLTDYFFKKMDTSKDDKISYKEFEGYILKK